MSTEKTAREEGLKKMESFDFGGSEPFDLESNYELVKKDGVDKEEAKSREATNILDSLGPHYMSSDEISELKKDEENVRNFIRRYDANKPEVQSMSEPQKDMVFGIAGYLVNKYAAKVTDAKFNISFSMNEFKFLHSVLTERIEFDSNEIFNMSELKEKFLDGAFEAYEETRKMKQSHGFQIEIGIKSLIILFHLFSKHKVKGASGSFELFRDLVAKMADMHKLFNAMNVVKERIGTEYQIWGAGLTTEPKEVTEMKAEMAKAAQEQV